MTNVIKHIDAVVGKALSSVLLPPVDSGNILHPRTDRILFIRPGGIGDAVLLIPAIQTVKQRWPHAIIDVLAESRNAAVFLLCPDINAIFRYDRPRELLSAIQGSYDVVIDTEQWHRLSAVVARMTKSSMKIGFATNERKRLFTHPIPYAQDDFELFSFLNMLTPLTGYSTSHPGKTFLTIPRAVLDKASTTLSPLSSRPIVALFPGGSIAERRWGADRFHQVAEMLSGRGYNIVVVGGKTDAREGWKIVHGIAHSLDLCGTGTLPDTAAVLQNASLLITGDSGIMHIGYGLGMRIVALFGPGREKKWAPTGVNCEVINKHLECSPCTTFGYTPTCRKNAACMEQISVDEVFTAAMRLLESP